MLIAASPEQKDIFARQLLDWFSRHMRPLPWRKGYSPYAVWISEIMLQQTQMERGVAYFNRWMERFPDLPSVAEAPEESILKAWEGLGYYSRARNLHAAAKRVMADFGGEFPCDPALIRSLPGVGDYTAGAIASIAFQVPVPAVDANVERVFARLCDIDAPVQSETKRFIRDTVAALMPPEESRAFTQALMELGALVCAKNPRCELCPLRDFCEARRLGVAKERPVPRKKKVYTNLEMATGILCHEGRVFIQKRPPYGVWAGLWEFPGGCLEQGETPEQAVVRELWEEIELPVRITGSLGVVRHAYTTCRVAMHGFFCEPVSPGAEQTVLHAATEGRWVTPRELGAFTFPAGHRKLIEQLRAGLWAQAV